MNDILDDLALGVQKMIVSDEPNAKLKMKLDILQMTLALAARRHSLGNTMELIRSELTFALTHTMPL
jgi:hypothetical protein